MEIGLPQQSDFSIGKAEAVREQPFHRHVATVEMPAKNTRSIAASSWRITEGNKKTIQQRKKQNTWVMHRG